MHLQEGAQPVQESETQRAFREAAARLQAKREREKMSADERIVHSLKGYMAEWKEDLDRRPTAAKHTTMGVQVTPDTISLHSCPHPAIVDKAQRHVGDTMCMCGNLSHLQASPAVTGQSRTVCDCRQPMAIVKWSGRLRRCTRDCKRARCIMRSGRACLTSLTL